MALLCLSTLLYSCSNDSFEDNYILSRVSSATIDDSVTVVSNFDDLTEMFNSDLASNPKLRATVIVPAWDGLPPGVFPPIRVIGGDDGVQNKTVTGYDNIRKGSTQRMTFTSDMAKVLGLSTGRIYHIHIRTIEKKITIPNGYVFFEDDSPLCGYSAFSINLGINFNKRGYSAGSGAANIILTTYIFFVEADEWAGKINKEFPCNASTLTWNYLLWKE